MSNINKSILKNLYNYCNLKMGNCCASNHEDKTFYLKELEGESSNKALGVKYRNKHNQQLTTDVFRQGDLAKVSNN
jgi:hypothetical protein